MGVDQTITTIKGEELSGNSNAQTVLYTNVTDARLKHLPVVNTLERTSLVSTNMNQLHSLDYIGLRELVVSGAIFNVTKIEKEPIESIILAPSYGSYFNTYVRVYAEIPDLIVKLPLKEKLAIPRVIEYNNSFSVVAGHIRCIEALTDSMSVLAEYRKKFETHSVDFDVSDVVHIAKIAKLYMKINSASIAAPSSAISVVVRGWDSDRREWTILGTSQHKSIDINNNVTIEAPVGPDKAYGSYDVKFYTSELVAGDVDYYTTAVETPNTFIMDITDVDLIPLYDFGTLKLDKAKKLTFVDESISTLYLYSHTRGSENIENVLLSDEEASAYGTVSYDVLVLDRLNNISFKAFLLPKTTTAHFILPNVYYYRDFSLLYKDVETGRWGHIENSGVRYEYDEDNLRLVIRNDTIKDCEILVSAVV